MSDPTAGSYARRLLHFDPGLQYLRGSVAAMMTRRDLGSGLHERAADFGVLALATIAAALVGTIATLPFIATLVTPLPIPVGAGPIS